MKTIPCKFRTDGCSLEFDAWTYILKDTFYVLGKKQQNLQLLDVLACNSANKQSFSLHFLQLETIVQKSARPILKRWYNNRVIDQNIKKCCICLMHIAGILKDNLILLNEKSKFFKFELFLISNDYKLSTLITQTISL